MSMQRYQERRMKSDNPAKQKTTPTKQTKMRMPIILLRLNRWSSFIMLRGGVPVHQKMTTKFLLPHRKVLANQRRRRVDHRQT